MAALHPSAGLDGDHLPPRLAGAVARSARPVPAPTTLRRVEPLAAVFLGLHGVMVLANLGGAPWQWAGVGLVLLLGLVSIGAAAPAGWSWSGLGRSWPWGRPPGKRRRGRRLVRGLAVRARRGLPAGPARALLDALTDPTAVLDPQGHIVAVNQAWARFAAGGLAVAVGQSYPAACGAAADAGYDGLAPAADGARAVLAGEVALFRCRYQAPGGAGPFEVTVTPLADGDGAVVTHRPPPA
jgi:PAS domain-containing protein